MAQATSTACVGEHVWLESGDEDLFGPATVVHISASHVSLQVTRYAGDVASQQKVVVSTSAFAALAPIVDLGELGLVERGKVHDAATMRAPSGPTLLHLCRRRYAHGHACTWLGAGLLVLGGARYDACATAEAGDEAAEDAAAHLAACANEPLPPQQPSTAELARHVLWRMRSLRRAQALAFVGGVNGGATSHACRVLRHVRRQQASRGDAAGVAVAESAHDGVLALHAFADAAGAERAALDGCVLWLRLRFDVGGRLRGGRLRGELFQPSRLCAGLSGRDKGGGDKGGGDKGGGDKGGDDMGGGDKGGGDKGGGGGGGVSTSASFRVAYLLLAGATDAERAELHLPSSAKGFAATKAGLSLQTETTAEQAAAFGRLRRQLLLGCGMGASEQRVLWKVLAALLHLAEMNSAASAGGGATKGGGGGGHEGEGGVNEGGAAAPADMRLVASLLGLDASSLSRTLASGKGAGRRRVAFVALVYGLLWTALRMRADEQARRAALSAGDAGQQESAITAVKAFLGSEPQAEASGANSAAPSTEESPAGMRRGDAPKAGMAAAASPRGAPLANPFFAQMKPGRAAKMMSSTILNSHAAADGHSADGARSVAQVCGSVPPPRRPQLNLPYPSHSQLSSPRPLSFTGARGCTSSPQCRPRSARSLQSTPPLIHR